MTTLESITNVVFQTLMGMITVGIIILICVLVSIAVENIRKKPVEFFLGLLFAISFIIACYYIGEFITPIVR